MSQVGKPSWLTSYRQSPRVLCACRIWYGIQEEEEGRGGRKWRGGGTSAAMLRSLSGTRRVGKTDFQLNHTTTFFPFHGFNLFWGGGEEGSGKWKGNSFPNIFFFFLFDRNFVVTDSRPRNDADGNGIRPKPRGVAGRSVLYDIFFFFFLLPFVALGAERFFFFFSIKILFRGKKGKEEG